MAKSKIKTKKKSATKTVKKPKKNAASSTKANKAPKSLAAANVGQKVAAFSVPATGGKTVSLEGLRGKKVVLYFYPKDATPGCTVEGQDFTRLHDAFRAAGAEVFGISRDTIKSHENFKANQKYSVDLLSDADEKLCQAFGVIKMKNMYGKQVRGIERSTFVIDEDGKLAKEWRGVRVPGHADEVLAYVKSLT